MCLYLELSYFFLANSSKLGRRAKDQSADPGLEFPRSACNGRNTEEYGAEG